MPLPLDPNRGRPRGWDEQKMLAAARNLFCERGYSGTSVRDLEDATNVRAPTLYRIYDSKDGLFLRALSSYVDDIVKTRVNIYLERLQDPLGGIRGFFRSTYENDQDERSRPGCLLANCAVEAPRLPEYLRYAINDGLDTILAGLRLAVTNARDARQIAREISPEDVAPQLLAHYLGIVAMARYGFSAENLGEITDGALKALLKPKRGRGQTRSTKR